MTVSAVFRNKLTPGSHYRQHNWSEKCPDSGSDRFLVPTGDGTTRVKADNPPPGDDTSIAPFADDNGGDDSSGSGFESSPFGFFLAKPADKIEITIRDRNKGIVRTITIDGETKPDIYDKTLGRPQ